MLGGHRIMGVPLGEVVLDGDDTRLLVVHIIALEFMQGHSNGCIHFIGCCCHLSDS